MQRGDIFLANFPFGDAPGMKLRPVLILSAPVGGSAEIVVAYISSVIPSALLPSNILLDPTAPEHVDTGLKVTSLLRLHKVATIHSSSAQRLLGSLSPKALLDVDAKLRAILTL